MHAAAVRRRLRVAAARVLAKPLSHKHHRHTQQQPTTKRSAKLAAAIWRPEMGAFEVVARGKLGFATLGVFALCAALCVAARSAPQCRCRRPLLALDLRLR